MHKTLKRREWLAALGATAAGLAGSWILAWPPAAIGAPRDVALRPAVDLQAEARAAAKTGLPLVLMFSRKDCPYCITVRRDYLAPLSQIARFKQVIVRQIDQDRDTPLKDFDGKNTTHAAFAARQNIKLVPVVSFHGSDGRQTSEAIIGARLPDFYQSYLEAALLQGQQR